MTIYYAGTRLPVPTAARVRILRTVYGLSPGEWEAILQYQSFRCAVCRKRFTRSRMPSVDHRHKDGLVRGALCGHCNGTLGVHHDDAEWFERAAHYLNNPPATYAVDTIYVPESPGAAGLLEETSA